MTPQCRPANTIRQSQQAASSEQQVDIAHPCREWEKFGAYSMRHPSAAITYPSVICDVCTARGRMSSPRREKVKTAGPMAVGAGQRADLRDELRRHIGHQPRIQAAWLRAATEHHPGADILDKQRVSRRATGPHPFDRQHRMMDASHFGETDRGHREDED